MTASRLHHARASEYTFTLNSMQPAAVLPHLQNVHRAPLIRLFCKQTVTSCHLHCWLRSAWCNFRCSRYKHAFPQQPKASARTTGPQVDHPFNFSNRSTSTSNALHPTPLPSPCPSLRYIRGHSQCLSSSSPNPPYHLTTLQTLYCTSSFTPWPLLLPSPCTGN